MLSIFLEAVLFYIRLYIILMTEHMRSSYFQKFLSKTDIFQTIVEKGNYHFVIAEISPPARETAVIT